MSLTHSEIADIIRIIDASTLDEVVLELGDLTIEVRRKGAVTGGAPAAAPAPTIPTAAQAPAVSTAAASASPAAADAVPAPNPAAALEAGQQAVRSPMVGTFYRRPAPDAPPFVEVGDAVEVGAPLCLVEVMKLFTTIYAQHAGRIARVCAEDAELVEYDQPLFVIDPS